VTDGESGEDLPIIDVRSPGERATDAGRARIEQFRTESRATALSVLAAVWMIGLTAIVASNAYSAFHFGAGGGEFSSVWGRLPLVAEEAGYSVAIATLGGLALAALAPRAVVASAFGVLLGGWVVFAGGCGVAAAVHGYDYPLSIVGQNRFALGVASAGAIAMGAVLCVAAWMLLTRSPDVADVS
jgi:hypothetical protein